MNTINCFQSNIPEDFHHAKVIWCVSQHELSYIWSHTRFLDIIGLCTCHIWINYIEHLTWKRGHIILIFVQDFATLITQRNQKWDKNSIQIFKHIVEIKFSEHNPFLIIIFTSIQFSEFKKRFYIAIIFWRIVGKHHLIMILHHFGNITSKETTRLRRQRFNIFVVVIDSDPSVCVWIDDSYTSCWDRSCATI